MNTVIQLLKEVLEISLFASVMIIVVLLIRAIVKDRINIKIISVLWLLVILRLCLPGMLDSPVHVDGLFPGSNKTQEVAEQQATQSQASSYEQNDVGSQLLNHDSVSQINDAAPDNTVISESQTNSFFEEIFKFIKSLDLWSSAALLWIIGGAIVLGLVLKESIVFGLRIRKSIYPLTDAMILDIVAEHKRANHLQRNIKVSVCPSVQMPLAFGVLHPHILLPLHFTDELCKEHIDAILLHEVCHIKRNDILKNYACVLAKTLHWFNPLVWISLKKIKEDMEFACDQRVLKLMKTGREIKYCESLLVATRFMKQKKVPQFVASLCESKSNLKKRIIKIVKPHKKSKSAAAISMVLALILLTACFTTACQPTPDNPVVVGKDQGKMLQEAAQTAGQNTSLSKRVEAPDKYTTNITGADGKLKITADASLIIPAADGMPTLRVKAADFTQEQVSGMVSALFGNQKLYEVQRGADTKDEISQEIVNLKKNKASVEYSSPGDQEQLDEQITRLENQYQTAPEKSEDVVTESDKKLKQMELKNEDGSHMAYYMGLNVTTNKGDPAQSATFSVQNNNDMKEAVLKFNKNGGGGGTLLRRNAIMMYSLGDLGNYGQHTPLPVDKNTVISDPKVLAKLKMTPEQAAELAKSKLKEAGVDYMDLYGMYVTDDENLGNVDGKVSSAEHYAYQLYFRRMVNGAPCSYLNGFSSVGGMDEAIKESADKGKAPDPSSMKYAGNWMYETMQMLIDDRGIISFSWMSPLEITDTLVQNSALQPFSRIKDIFEQYMKIKYEPQAKDGNVVDITFKVDHVSLELQRITEQNSIENGLLVPVWNFYGTGTSKYAQSQETNNILSGGDAEPTPMLTVNAIDGSVIDINMGY